MDKLTKGLDTLYLLVTGEEQLETVLENLEHEADTVNRLLMRFLHVRDKRAGRLVNQYTKLTLILRHFAQMNGKKRFATPILLIEELMMVWKCV